jgi:catechol 2,3-dioxygenase-like lactoylglutathione lyase family enzyme
MAKIRHIALSTQDPERTATFYAEVFGMERIGRIDHPAVRGYFLSDGDINLAVLNFKSDAAAGAERGKDYVGIHHIGFQVESLEAIAARLGAAGSARRDDVNHALDVGGSGRRYVNVEVKYTGPDGVMLDVSETGWVGASGFRPLPSAQEPVSPAAAPARSPAGAS